MRPEPSRPSACVCETPPTPDGRRTGRPSAIPKAAVTSDGGGAADKACPGFPWILRGRSSADGTGSSPAAGSGRELKPPSSPPKRFDNFLSAHIAFPGPVPHLRHVLHPFPRCQERRPPPVRGVSVPRRNRTVNGRHPGPFHPLHRRVSATPAPPRERGRRAFQRSFHPSAPPPRP